LTAVLVSLDIDLDEKGKCHLFAKEVIKDGSVWPSSWYGGLKNGSLGYQQQALRGSIS